MKTNQNRRQVINRDQLSIKVTHDIDDATRISIQDLIDWGCVDPLYVPIAKDAIKTKRKHTLHCKLTARLIVALVKANGRNRSRNYPHVAGLAMAMRSDYRLELTDNALTTDGLNANGGHSAAAFIAAFFPLDVFTRLGLFPVVEPISTAEDAPRDKQGNLKTHTVNKMPPFPKSAYEDDAKQDSLLWCEVDRDTGTDDVDTGDGIAKQWELWDDEEYLADLDKYLDHYFQYIPDERIVRIMVNVDPDAVRKYDTVGRGRKGEEQLELFGPSRAFIESSDVFDGKTLETVLKCAHLRSKVEPTKDPDDGKLRYGTPKGGGNTNKEQFPVFFLAHAEGIVDHVNAASNGVGFAVHEKFSAIPVKDALIVITNCNDKSAAEKLGNALRAGRNATLESLSKALTKPNDKKRAALWRKPDASYIQAVLMSVAFGRQIDFGKDAAPPIHQLAARGKGWDRGDEQGNETYKDALQETAEKVDKYFGDDAKRATAYREKRKYSRRK